ncbi:MAG TPA: STAS domain-containing protein [Blastocatellia bacterium]|nr:STAS domain-containing protein [Blastocatellia bacterium]
MDSVPSSDIFRVTERESGESVIMEGELSQANADEFAAYLRALKVRGNGAVTLNLSGLDIHDGVALATAIDALRDLRARAGRLVLRGAPQMLCHNLYRVGMLGGSDSIELVDMRLDEPSGF